MGRGCIYGSFSKNWRRMAIIFCQTTYYKQKLDENKKIIVMCHSGVRSANVCQYLEPLGYNVYNLIGGIDAWSKLIDPSVPIY